MLSKSIFILALLLIFTTIGLKAQQYVLIKGQVWDFTGEQLVGAHAFNKTRHYGTFTDRDGIFFLVMNPGDSLQVTMVGYKPYKMKIPQKLSADTYKLDVTLMGDTIMLKSAEIKPYPETYAELKQQFVKLKVPEEKILDRITLPNEIYRSKYANPDGTGLVIGGPITALYMAFSREGKELKKMSTIMASDRLREKLLSIISREVLEKKFALKSDQQIDDMIQNCNITEEFLQRNSGYEVIRFIMRCTGRK
mgnify:FL=1|jgi:hypothetical protein